MPNNIETAREYLNKAREIAKGVVTSRWGLRAAVGSLMALGVLSSPESVIAQPVITIYGIDACSPYGDDWMNERHRHIGFIFGERGAILSEGRAVAVTDVKARRTIVTHYEHAGKIADTWTSLTHGAVASIDPEQVPIPFLVGQSYFVEVVTTNDPKSIKTGGSSIAIVPFAGCEPLNQLQ